MKDLLHRLIIKWSTILQTLFFALLVGCGEYADKKETPVKTFVVETSYDDVVEEESSSSESSMESTGSLKKAIKNKKESLSSSSRIVSSSSAVDYDYEFVCPKVSKSVMKDLAGFNMTLLTVNLDVHGKSDSTGAVYVASISTAETMSGVGCNAIVNMVEKITDPAKFYKFIGQKPASLDYKFFKAATVKVDNQCSNKKTVVVSMEHSYRQGYSVEKAKDFLKLQASRCKKLHVEMPAVAVEICADKTLRAIAASAGYCLTANRDPKDKH